MYSGVFFMCLTAMPSVVIAQAPGDGDSYCLSTFPPSIFSSNTRILMDSYHYITLLSIRSGAVWQQVDRDGRIPFWYESGGSACRQVVTTCGIKPEIPQSNWLITQFINRTRVDGTRLPNINIQIEYRQWRCPVCVHLESRMYIYETSTIDSNEARNTNRYSLISEISTANSYLHNQTRSFEFTTNENGFYFAFVPRITCLTVSRVIVFYNICRQEIVGLVIRPETIAPPMGIREVAGQCVANADTESGAVPTLMCSPDGAWSVIISCRCNQGYQAAGDEVSCVEVCATGTYLSVTHDECRICPENTVGTEPGLLVCPCVEGYYRAPGEEDLPCTYIQPPSPVRNVRIVSQTPGSITLMWDPPVNFGGRNGSIAYILSYKTEEDSSHIDAATVNITMGTIKDLPPSDGILVTVIATNGGLESIPVTILHRVSRRPNNGSGTQPGISGVTVTVLFSIMSLAVFLLLLVISIFLIKERIRKAMH